MINFHKKTGKPAKVQSGHEDVWFSTSGLYVSDNAGNPKLITASTATGTTTPVGVPAEPNMLYFNSTTRKSYISTNDKWLEIPTSAIPGSGSGGGGNAGNVMITDAGNWYTSNDVEGALNEIGEAIPHLLGTKLLPNYGDNVNNINTSSEHFLTATATNKPSTQTGWAINRRTTGSQTYGFVVDTAGNAFTRVGTTYRQLALDTQIATLDTRINNLSSSTNSTLSGYKIKELNAGNGLTVTKGSNGTYTVASNADTQNLLNQVKNGAFLKKTGDTATGNMTINNPHTTAIYYGRDSTNTNYAGFRVGQEGFGIYDYGRGQTFLRKLSAGNFEINGHGKNNISNIRVEHKLNFSTTRTDGGYGFEFHHTKSPGAAAVIYGKSANGEFGIGSTPTWNYFDVGDGKGGRGAGKGLRIGRLGGGNIPWLRLDVETVYANWSFSAASGLHIGSNLDASGPVAGNARVGAKIYFYPYDHDGSWTQRQTYVGLGWNAKQDIFTFHRARKNNKVAAGYDSYGQVKIRAGGFVVASSEEYKDIHGQFEVNVLDDIKEMKPYLYNYKNSSKTELGFVFERKVPKLLQEGKPGEGGLNTYALVTYLWKGVQELTEKVETLERRLSE